MRGFKMLGFKMRASKWAPSLPFKALSNIKCPQTNRNKPGQGLATDEKASLQEDERGFRKQNVKHWRPRLQEYVRA
jgi:hypothetical protein